MTPKVPSGPPNKPVPASSPAKKASPYFSAKGIRWLFWGALAGVAPFIAETLLSAILGTFKISTVLGRGDLMLVGAAIGFTAVAELIANNKTNATGKLIASAVCAVSSFIEAIVYGALKGFGQTGHEGAISIVSVCMFLLSLISGYACILLSE